MGTILKERKIKSLMKGVKIRRGIFQARQNNFKSCGGQPPPHTHIPLPPIVIEFNLHIQVEVAILCARQYMP